MKEAWSSALAEGIPHIEIYVSASETHSQRNSGMSSAKALSLATRMIGQALESDKGVTAGVMCAFGCFYEGPVALDKVLDIIRQFVSAGAVEIGLADTPGLAEPSGVKTVVTAVGEVVSLDRLTLHLHDTRGYGMANLRAALDMGVRQFDTSLGGLGGCPFHTGRQGQHIHGADSGYAGIVGLSDRRGPEKTRCYLGGLGPGPEGHLAFGRLLWFPTVLGISCPAHCRGGRPPIASC